MKDDFTARLLDESLKQYSRVSPPEGFEARLKTRLEAGGRRLMAPRWWLVMSAAGSLALVLFLVRPAPLPPPPEVRLVSTRLPIFWSKRPILTAPATQPLTRKGPRFLSAQELAHLELPAELFARPEEKPLRDLEVPELVIPPLSGGEDKATKER